jgi:DNA-binding response OmpR family regulator
MIEHADLGGEDLLAQGWDKNAGPFTQTVRVTIAGLRRNSVSRSSSTTPGVGHRIAPSAT